MTGTTRRSEAEDPLEGTTWVFESVSIEGASREAIPEAQVTASFSDGELAGATGCNRYSLSYSVDGSELHRGALLLTGAACDSSAIVEQEDVYIAALERIEEFSVSEERLELRDSAREVLIVFVSSGADLAE